MAQQDHEAFGGRASVSILFVVIYVAGISYLYRKRNQRQIERRHLFERFMRQVWS